MTASRFVNPRPQFFDDSGKLLVNGEAFFYDSGTLSTKVTYADVNETVPNAQPVVLSEDGRMPNVFYTGTARVILTDDAGQVWDIGDVGQFGSGSGFDVWNDATEYGLSDIVEGSDGLIYRSLVNTNIGNNPTTSAVQWENISFIRLWNTNVTYAIGNVVKDTTGIMYRSKTNSNTANNPATDTTNWAFVVDETWTQIDSVSPTAVTSFQMTGIPSTAVSVLIVMSNIVTANSGTTQQYVRVMDDSVVQTTGYIAQGVQYQNSATTLTNTETTVLPITNPGAGLSTHEHFAVCLLVKNASTGVWVFKSDGFITGGGAPFEPMWNMAHTPTIAGTMNGLEFANDGTETYSAGTVTAYYSKEQI